MTESAVPVLVAHTRALEHTDDILSYADAVNPGFWQRGCDGFVCIGEVHRLSPGSTLADAWRRLAGAAQIEDSVSLPGTGLIGFGAFSFDPASAHPGALVIPAIVVGRRGDQRWITQIARVDEALPAPPEPTEFGAHWSASFGPGAQAPAGYQAAVKHAIAKISSGDLDKVVLARDLIGNAPASADLRRLVRALTSGYPDCWVYAADGMIGASPETLVTVTGGTVTARVLAGTTARGADADADMNAARALATSPKDLDEHRFAVQSVLASLRSHTSAVAAAEAPFTLRLPNLWHLATDVEGSLREQASALDLVAALHPTAAVAGTPTGVALDLIKRLEPFDRGRYAGPVGWVDAHGDGEWAIALRCAQFGPVTVGAATRSVIAHAGAGIVADSIPESELLETRVKFRPIVDALA